MTDDESRSNRQRQRTSAPGVRRRTVLAGLLATAGAAVVGGEAARRASRETSPETPIDRARRRWIGHF